jgi:hypothetical protein
MDINQYLYICQKKQQKPIFIIDSTHSGIAKGDIVSNGEQDALALLLEKAGVDLNVWYVENYKIKKGEWDVTMKVREFNDKGKVIGEGPVKKTNYLFNIEVNLKRKVLMLDTDHFVKEMVSAIKAQIKPTQLEKMPYKRYYRKDRHLFMPMIPDLHLGKLAWAEESKQNYDIKIAQKFFKDAMNYLIALSTPYKVDRILLVTGNDTFNYDYAHPYPMTTRGTPQEADVRWQKMFRVGVELWIWAIETLKQIAPVDVINMPGNHDYQTGFYLGEVLRTKYELDENVDINNLACPRRYYKYGQNLIGLAHGRIERPNQLHNQMSIDEGNSEGYWNQTKYRYFYLGDRHHEEELRSNKAVVKLMEDYRGVQIEYFPTLAQVDKYEFESGYVGTIKAAKALIHNHEHGRCAKLGFNL